MTARDVDDLRRSLMSIADAALVCARQAEDLHVEAHEKRVSGEQRVAVGGLPSGVDSVGDPRARAIWDRLTRTAAAAEIDLVAAAQAVGNLLSSGPGAKPSRGSLIRKSDFRLAQKMQRKRKRAGEYVPWRTEDQPDYPGK